jgi:hypothetical protein
MSDGSRFKQVVPMRVMKKGDSASGFAMAAGLG